jgi:hypothetical protein
MQIINATICKINIAEQVIIGLRVTTGFVFVNTLSPRKIAGAKSVITAKGAYTPYSIGAEGGI